MQATYTLTDMSTVVSHFFPSKVLAFHDGLSFKNLRIDAEARSGDYFTTLATRLETVSEDIAAKEPSAAQILDIIASDLEYMQSHYAITSKLRIPQKKHDQIQ
jgi:hypothetical protein